MNTVIEYDAVPTEDGYLNGWWLSTSKRTDSVLIDITELLMTKPTRNQIRKQRKSFKKGNFLIYPNRD